MGTPEVCERVKAAGDAVGEPAWPMPLPDDVRKGMDSDIADISQVNASMDRAGHMLQGGVFLREFVAEGVDVGAHRHRRAAYHSGEPTGYWTKGGTGVPVRTLLAADRRRGRERLTPAPPAQAALRIRPARRFWRSL